MCEIRQHYLPVAAIYDLPSTPGIEGNAALQLTESTTDRTTDLDRDISKISALVDSTMDKRESQSEAPLPTAISATTVVSASRVIDNTDPERAAYFRNLRESLRRGRR